MLLRRTQVAFLPVFSVDQQQVDADRDPDEPLLLRRQGTPGARISSNRSSFRYKPFNRRSTNGTLVYCDDRGQAAARAVVISYTGRPRVTALTASGSSLDCSA